MKVEEKCPQNPNAFPNTIVNDHGIIITGQNGMTLRDYFANSIMASYIKEHLELLRENKFGYTVKDMADSSYLIADAMLKQREL